MPSKNQKSMELHVLQSSLCIMPICMLYLVADSGLFKANLEHIFLPFCVMLCCWIMPLGTDVQGPTPVHSFQGHSVCWRLMLLRRCSFHASLSLVYFVWSLNSYDCTKTKVLSIAVDCYNPAMAYKCVILPVVSLSNWSAVLQTGPLY